MAIHNLAICATLSSFLFGYDTGIINGVNLLIKQEFNLDDDWIAHIVSSTTAAAAVFSIAVGITSDALGRKTSIMMSAIVFVVGGILMAVARGPNMLLIGRIIVGFAIATVSCVVPVYVSECSPPNIRGSLLTLFQLFITIGIWISAVIAMSFQKAQYGWRYMLGLSAVPGIFQYFIFVAMPESPRYHILNNDCSAALRALELIRNTPDVTEELRQMMDAHEEEPKVRGFGVIRQILITPKVRYALFVGCMLQVFQQFSGINAVIYYSSIILKSAGFDLHYAISLSLIPFAVNFMATFIGFWAVEAIGRRKTLGFSFLGNSIALLFLVIAFLPEYFNPDSTDKMYEQGYNVSGSCTEIRADFESLSITTLAPDWSPVTSFISFSASLIAYSSAL
ncbi:proton myo-inositol cotransporter [Elysia marginata]|uniref:Proton myo-inositol cotransporter n=1 Tax=Elysia marginata TaxID=1093978 RepID=A0AAV4HLX6_9GAST|nr:proton myo-inositol cotransporter [Elysia marginata]